MTTLVLLPTTTYGVPSGNYDGSSSEFIGNAQPAASYYRGQGSVQTMPIQLTNFVGQVIIETTLSDQATINPDFLSQSDFALNNRVNGWFIVGTYGDPSTTTTGTTAITVEGNFVWLRARVIGFTGGTINSANVIY